MNEATQTGVAMAIVGMIGTVAGLLVGYFKDRDKLRYDHELGGLRAQNAGQARQIEALERSTREGTEAHERTLSELKMCMEHHRATDARLAALERRQSAADRGSP